VATFAQMDGFVASELKYQKRIIIGWSGAELSGAELSGAELSGAELSEASCAINVYTWYLE
jgi:uncharacterized protein YjbI with pentapeptide repeats